MKRQLNSPSRFECLVADEEENRTTEPDEFGTKDRQRSRSRFAPEGESGSPEALH
jgi:hypothetical protein